MYHGYSLEQQSRNQTQELYTVRRSASLPVCQSAGLPVHRFSGRNEERTDREES